jgi:hypothetical protein
MERALATTSPHIPISFLVYPDTVGFPVVPEVVWISTISSVLAANIPKGYASRRSLLVVNGNFSISSRV